MIILALASGAWAYTMERWWPEWTSYTFEPHVRPFFAVRYGGLTHPAHWIKVEWYVDWELQKGNSLSGQTAYCTFTPDFDDLVGTHEVTVRAQYYQSGIKWTDYTTWISTVVPHPPTAERVSPDSPVLIFPGDTEDFTAVGSDPGVFDEILHIAGVRWYLDNCEEDDVAFGMIFEPTIEHTWSHTFTTGGTYEVRAVFYDEDGSCSDWDQAVWIVEVGHTPRGTILSPSSPVTINMGVPMTFTLEGADAADDLRLCEVTVDGVRQTDVFFSGPTSGSIATWTHTFNATKAYQVAFTPVDQAGNRGTEQVWTVIVEDYSGKAGLTGTVIALDTRGTAKGPLVGATVELTGPAAVATATTDGLGRFSFAGLDPGTWTVTVGKTGYYSSSKAVSLATGETKDELFRLTQESKEPSTFDLTTLPLGKHFVEGMPGALSFSVLVAWNGAPGAVRFNVAGTWYSAAILGRGADQAEARLTVPMPTTVSKPHELTVEVVNGDGKKTIVNTGVFFYPVPEIVSTWYPGFRFEGPTWNFRYDMGWTLWNIAVGARCSTSCEAGLQGKVNFNPLAGVFEGSIGGFGAFGLEMDVDKVMVFGENRLAVAGNLQIALAGLNPPKITPSWTLSLSGERGVEVPMVVAIDILFPPAAPATSALLKTPILGDALKALRLRASLTAEGQLLGEYEGGQFGDCFLGTTRLSGSVTLGVEGQVVIRIRRWWVKASAGVYAGVSGTPEFEFCPDVRFEAVTLRGYVGAFASIWGWQRNVEVGMSLRWESSGATKGLSIASVPDVPPIVWEPIGDKCLRWGPTNLLVEPRRSGGSLHSLSAPDESSHETKLVENVVSVANPAIVSRPSEKLILFCLQDPDKPWWAASDIGTVRQTAGQPWSLDRIADDQAAEFNPSLGAADSGDILAVWERVEGDTSDANDPGQIAPHMEIVTAWLDPTTGIWSTPQQLTSNALMDRQPMPIALGAARGVLWIANEGDAATGEIRPADRLMFAPWSPWVPGGWTGTTALWSPQKPILGYAFVADNLDEGHVVLAVDEDGDPNTTVDCELYLLSTVNGLWQTATQLTSDFVADTMPTLVTPNGGPMCVWNADGTLFYSPLDDWNPKPVYREYTLANEAPSLDGVTMPGGAAIAYTVQGPNGVDIVASFYDAGFDCWSLPRQLTTDEHAESALSLTWDGDELVIAYLKTQTLRHPMNVEIDGQMHHLENIPQPGRTDLYVLRHGLGYDAAVVPHSLALDPANPVPGKTATIVATIENGGDLPLQEVAATFYDGDPAHGGVAIGKPQVIPGTLIAGGKQDVAVAWNVPPDKNPHQIFVVVDPGLVGEDRDRSNDMLSVRAVLPNLAVETCWTTEVSGTSMALTARVVNTGTVPAGPCQVSWRTGAADGTQVGTSMIPVLIASGAYEASFIWDTTGRLQPGQTVEVFAVVDATGSVPESDESDNVSNLAVFHTPPPSGPIIVENSSFELPGTVKIKGWNGEGVDDTPAVDIPGWRSDSVAVDSGVETGYTPTDGLWTAFMMSGDPAIWQLTGHTIAAGEVFELKVDARNTGRAATLRIVLYYDDAGTRTWAAERTVGLTDAMQEYTVTFDAAQVPESVGNKIGIEFANVTSAGDTWLGLDNVRLSLVPRPDEPTPR